MASHKNMRIDKTGRQSGFSLVELMVGLVVAMVAMVIVAQIFTLSEGSRRTTTGGDDAQTSGALAITELQRELRQAGQGIVSPNLIGCNLSVGTWTVNSLAPVTINHPNIPAGDAGTDTLLIIYGSGVGSPEGDRINAQPSTNDYATAVSSGFHQYDRVIATPTARAAPCSLLLDQVTAAPVVPDVLVKSGVAGMANGVLFNLGTAPRIVGYAVRNGRMTTCDYMLVDCSGTSAGQWVDMADGVVSMRAVYGRDTTPTPDGQLDTYDQTTPTTTNAWSCVLGTRVVVVARSGQLEKTDVTTTAPVWAAAAAASVNLSGNTNWTKYRYKTFETIVPMRNLTWQGVPSSC